MEDDDIEEISFDEDDGVTELKYEKAEKYLKPSNRVVHNLKSKAKEKFSEWYEKRKAKAAEDKAEREKYKSLLDKEEKQLKYKKEVASKRLKYKQDVASLRNRYSTKKTSAPSFDLFGSGSSGKRNGGMQSMKFFGTSGRSNRSSGLDLFGSPPRRTKARRQSNRSSNSLNFYLEGGRKQSRSWF